MPTQLVNSNEQLSPPLQEQVEDFVGAMATGGAQTGIAVTYNDPAGTLGFDVTTFSDARYTLFDGWTADANTWSYSSADAPTFVISINANMTGTLNVGDKIKLNQSGNKYFIVTAVGSYGGGATLITVYGGTDYTLANAAISSPYYSHAKSPIGFPLSPAKWTVTVTNTSTHTQTNPTASTWYNLGTITIDIPIGVWEVTYDAYVDSVETGSDTNVNVTLSTANNTESDATRTMAFGISAAPKASNGKIEIASNFQKTFPVTLASKTTHYLNEKVNVFTVDSLALLGAISTTSIRAECVYL